MAKRETALDLLRLLALLGVIFTHAGGITTDSTRTKYILAFLMAAVTWHVPVFVMISGRFFLDPSREVTAVKLRKAIIRLVIAFLFWNVVYQIYNILSGFYVGLNWKGILSEAMQGPYHLWFLFMMACLYAITPFLRKIAEDRNLTEYFIVLFLIFEFLTMYGPSLPLIGATVELLMNKTQFHFALGFSGYYLLGYYLHRYPLTGKKEMGLYLLGIAMFLFTGFATVWNVCRGVEGNEWFSKYLMPNVAIEAAALYTFFVNRISRIPFSERCTGWISRLAEYSFGMYLVHALIIPLSGMLLWNRIPLVIHILFIFISSAVVTALIRKIPRIGKKIT